MPAPRVALITGCSRGIGHHSALRLRREGWEVVATLRSGVGREALEAAGADVVHLDVTDSDAVAEVIGRVVERHGRLDALVANAGRGIFGCFEDVSPAQVRMVFEVNFFGVLSCARAALPHLRESRGHLVLMSSVAGRRGAPSSSIYSASKFALEGWGEAMRHELAPFGVRVVLIEPGSTESGFLGARLRAEGAGKGAYARLSDRLEQAQDELRNNVEPVETVTDALVDALGDPAPPLRLVTGRSAQVQMLAKRLLPWRVYERIVQRKLDLPEM